MSLTVACVLKSGGVYSPRYVQVLRNQVCRNLGVPYRFVCISDVDVPCERIPMKYNFPGKWAKMELFRPDIDLGDRVLYFDLDAVIQANINCLVKPHDFTFRAPSPEYKTRTVPGNGKQRVRQYSSAAMCFVPGSRPQIWAGFSQDTMDRYVGDQDYLGDTVPDGSLFSEDEVYKFDPLKHTHSRPESRVVVFANAYPHEMKHRLLWVKRCWK